MKITTRTRLGLGWSNTPKRNEWAIEADTEPSECGTIGQLQNELDRLAKINNGNEWTWSYYVKIDGEWLRLGRSLSQDILTDYWLYQHDNNLGQFHAEVDRISVENRNLSA